MILGKGATRMSARELKLELDRSKNKMKEKYRFEEKFSEIGWRKG